MYKILLTAITVLLLPVSAFSSFSIKLPHKKVEVENRMGTAIFYGAHVSGEPGDPALPNYTVRFLLPEGADLNTVKVKSYGLKDELIPGNFDVAPVMPMKLGDKTIWPEKAKIINGRNLNIYKKNAYFPATYYGNLTTGKFREFNLVEVTINPYRYNPVTKVLRRITSGMLYLTFTNDGENNIAASDVGFSKRDLEVLKFLGETTINADSMYYNDENGKTRNLCFYEINPYIFQLRSKFAILTTDDIVSNSSELFNFMNSKFNKGFDVLLVRENILIIMYRNCSYIDNSGGWGGGTGDTAAENIRAWLKAPIGNKERWEAWNIDYLLLIGNPHPETGDVPMKIVNPLVVSNDPGYNPEDVPTDYYYAELSNDDWDDDGDGYQGEYYWDSNSWDIYSEISVGRIPVYSPVSDYLDNILKKTIDYENMILFYNWRKNVLLPMEPADAMTDSWQLGEDIKNNILQTNNFSYFRIYDDINVYDGDITGAPADLFPCTMNNVRDTWNNNYFGLVVWQSHGSQTSAVDVYDSTYASEINDDYPAFTFQASCQNGYPENDNNLAYALLKNGAIGTVGASRNAAYQVGQTSYTTPEPTVGVMAYKYTYHLVEEQCPAGDALQAMKADYNPTYYLHWWNYLTFNLYGDPSIGLFSYSMPELAPLDNMTILQK